MKQINGYWVDENNNRWDCEICSEVKAETFSKTLINCTDCTDCTKCIDCTNCINCCYCDSCYGCANCLYCHNCVNCHLCSGCVGCHDCDSCYNFKENPQIYTTKKIGGRNAHTIFYYGKTDKGMKVRVICDFFKGNLEEFENAVLETHANNDEYREQYLREIEKVKVLFELN